MKQFLLFLGMLSFSIASIAQCIITIPSTDNYTVEIELTPKSIKAPNHCDWGYNFNVAIDYDIRFIGENAPANLWTLQGQLGCSGFNDSFFQLPNKNEAGSTETTGNVWNPDKNCGTATVASLGCSQFSLEIHGPGIPRQTIECDFALPVELLYFTTEVASNEVNINWATATETNNDYFSLERSADGETWEEITIVNGQGDSVEETEYSYTDEQPLEGISYYRLKQTDFDFAFSYSPVEVVEFRNLSIAPLKVFPNPVVDVVTIEAEAIIANHLAIYSLNGQLIGKNFLVLSQNDSTVKLDLSHLPKGIYIITDGKRQQKISKV